MDSLARLIASKPLVILFIIAVVSVFAGAQFIDFDTGKIIIPIDPSSERVLPQSGPAVEMSREVRKLFGNDESYVIVLDSETLFAKETLSRIFRITRKLQELEDVQQVTSLASVLDIRGIDEELVIEPLIPRAPETDQDAQRIRTAALANPLYSESLISADGEATVIVATLHNSSDRALSIDDLDNRITGIVAQEQGDTRAWITGMPHIETGTAKVLFRDLIRILPIMAIVLTGVLIFSFRSVMGVLAPLLTVCVGVLFTLATITSLGYSLNLVTTLIPPLMMALGLAYAVHVVSEYHEVAKLATHGTCAADITTQVLRNVALPVLLTGATTIAGFASLTLSSMPAIFEFGVFAIIGVVFTTLLSLTLAPTLMNVTLTRFPITAESDHKAAPGRFERFTETAAEFDLNRRIPIFVGTAVLVLVAALSMTQIQVGTEHVKNFSPDNPIRQHFDAIEKRIGGTNNFYVTIKTASPDTLKQPEALLEIEELQAWLKKQPEISQTNSLVDYLKLINQGFHNNDTAFHAVPDDALVISQLYFFGANEELERFVDGSFQTANIIVRASAVDSNKITDLISRINLRLSALPENWVAHVTGSTVVFNQALEDIIYGQIQSIGLALLIVYLLLVGLFMSFRIGAVALLPNIVPVIFFFGAIGLLGISLNPGTSIIAPMVLGIAIDDTIHYFTRFNRYAKEMANERLATVKALKSVGRPITYTTVGLCLGFLVMTQSELSMQAQVGLMGALTLAVAWLCDFILTPALCASVRIVTLWDALTLDLGPEPQKSIPLLKGLSKTQARIVALMASLRTFSAGEKIIRTGEPGDSMYVVVDGVLRASIAGEQGPVILNTHQRGDVIGEVGLYQNTRSADVEVIEDARLLRFTPSNMQRLEKRYPRIAAKVFSNLNEVLVGRLVNLTGRVNR